MKLDIKVPAMGESISEAIIGTLLKPNGSQVNLDDEILELETDKVNQVLYAQSSGMISWNIHPEETVKIGQIIGSIETAAKISSSNKDNALQQQTKTPQLPESAIASTKEPIKESSIDYIETMNVKPEAKLVQASIRFHKEDFLKTLTPTTHSAEPQQINPTENINSAESSATSAKCPLKGERKETRKKISKIRKVIASRLLEVQHHTAMLTTFNEIDLSAVATLRENHKESFMKHHGTKLGYMSFFVKAAVAALAEYPGVNSYIDGDDIVQREYFDIGIAVSTDRGLIVPVIKDCDHLTFAGIESAIEGFAKKARDGKLTVADLQGGGFTITNGGTFGSLLSTPILNPSQCGILGMHKIVKRPVVVNDEIVIRPMMYVALSYDHRIIDGKEAVSFLVHIKNSLEDPANLLLDL